MLYPLADIVLELAGPQHREKGTKVLGDYAFRFVEGILMASHYKRIQNIEFE